MKTLFKCLLILSFALFVGCDDSDDITINASNKLIGYWLNQETEGLELRFKRAGSLKKDVYGIAFLSENECIERTSGWCGTPPISYFDMQGSWSQKDKIITIFERQFKNSKYNFHCQF